MDDINRHLARLQLFPDYDTTPMSLEDINEMTTTKALMHCEAVLKYIIELVNTYEEDVHNNNDTVAKLKADCEKYINEIQEGNKTTKEILDDILKWTNEHKDILSITQNINELNNNKADRSEIANGLTAKGSCNYANLPKNNNKVGDYWYCKDGNGTDGRGNYVWNGSTWYFGGTGDEGYNKVINNLEYVQKNIYKLSPTLTGGYLNYKTGVRTTTTDGKYKQTQLIPIPAGCVQIRHNFFTNTLGVAGWCVFGSNGISETAYKTGGINNVINVDKSWKYISLTSFDETLKHENKEILFLFNADEKYKNNIIFFPPLTAGYIEQSGGLSNHNDNLKYNRTEYYIPIPLGTKIIHHNFNNYGINGWCIYDVDKNKLKNGYEKTITDIKGNYAYIALTDYDYQTNHNGKYIEFICKDEEKYIYKDITAGFIGDSITFGLDPDNIDNLQMPNCWVEQVCDKLKFKDCLNYGISSSTVVPVPEQSDVVRNPMIKRFNNMSDDCSIVGVLAGINDAFNNIPLGTMTDRTQDTFYGGLHILFKGLVQKYKRKDGKKVFVLTYPQYDYLSKIRSDVTFEQWTDAIKEVAKYYSIPVCDLYNNLGISPYMDDNFEYWRVFQTHYHNPHPTQLCADIIADYVSNWITKNL